MLSVLHCDSFSPSHAWHPSGSVKRCRRSARLDYAHWRHDALSARPWILSVLHFFMISLSEMLKVLTTVPALVPCLLQIARRQTPLCRPPVAGGGPGRLQGSPLGCVQASGCPHSGEPPQQAPGGARCLSRPSRRPLPAACLPAHGKPRQHSARILSSPACLLQAPERTEAHHFGHTPS